MAHKLLHLQTCYRIPTEIDDVRVAGFDFVIRDESWPDVATTHKYETLESDFDTWWASIGDRIANELSLTEYRWYREDDGSLPWGDPARVTLRALPGLNQGNMCPPQVACTVTEETRRRRSWGRFYIPGIAADQCSPTGRLNAAAVADIALATRDLYNAVATRGVFPVVLAKQGISVNQVIGQADPGLIQPLEVTGVRVDNVLDVIRSRRYKQPTARQLYDIVDAA